MTESGIWIPDVLPEPPEPSQAELLRQYQSLHAVCPACGVGEFSMTGDLCVIVELESHYDWNQVTCDRCGWTGIVHDLVPSKRANTFVMNGQDSIRLVAATGDIAYIDTGSDEVVLQNVELARKVVAQQPRYPEPLRGLCVLLLKIADAPAWHDKPTKPGHWFLMYGDGEDGIENAELFHIRQSDIERGVGFKFARAFGPIPKQ